jgi:hypothetical protein
MISIEEFTQLPFVKVKKKISRDRYRYQTPSNLLLWNLIRTVAQIGYSDNKLPLRLLFSLFPFPSRLASISFGQSEHQCSSDLGLGSPAGPLVACQVRRKVEKSMTSCCDALIDECFPARCTISTDRPEANL